MPTDSSMDYTAITADQFPLTQFAAQTQSRRECFDVIITDDSTLENEEEFYIDLSLDSLFGSQERTRITLNSTTIRIIDDDGKYKCMAIHK